MAWSTPPPATPSPPAARREVPVSIMQSYILDSIPLLSITIKGFSLKHFALAVKEGHTSSSRKYPNALGCLSKVFRHVLQNRPLCTSTTPLGVGARSTCFRAKPPPLAIRIGSTYLRSHPTPGYQPPRASATSLQRARRLRPAATWPHPQCLAGTCRTHRFACRGRNPKSRWNGPTSSCPPFLSTSPAGESWRRKRLMSPPCIMPRCCHRVIRCMHRIVVCCMATLEFSCTNPASVPAFAALLLLYKR